MSGGAGSSSNAKAFVFFPFQAILKDRRGLAERPTRTLLDIQVKGFLIPFECDLSWKKFEQLTEAEMARYCCLGVENIFHRRAVRALPFYGNLSTISVDEVYQRLDISQDLDIKVLFLPRSIFKSNQPGRLEVLEGMAYHLPILSKGLFCADFGWIFEVTLPKVREIFPVLDCWSGESFDRCFFDHAILKNATPWYKPPEWPPAVNQGECTHLIRIGIVQDDGKIRWQEFDEEVEFKDRVIKVPVKAKYNPDEKIARILIANDSELGAVPIVVDGPKEFRIPISGHISKYRPIYPKPEPGKLKFGHYALSITKTAAISSGIGSRVACELMVNPCHFDKKWYIELWGLLNHSSDRYPQHSWKPNAIAHHTAADSLFIAVTVGSRPAPILWDYGPRYPELLPINRSKFSTFEDLHCRDDYTLQKAFFEACALGNRPRAERLLGLGADISGTDQEGRNAAHYVVMRRGLLNEIYLKEYGEYPTDAEVAECFEKRKEVIALLVNKNVNFAHQNSKGNSAIDLMRRGINTAIEDDEVKDFLSFRKLLHYYSGVSEGFFAEAHKAKEVSCVVRGILSFFVPPEASISDYSSTCTIM